MLHVCDYVETVKVFVLLGFVAPDCRDEGQDEESDDNEDSEIGHPKERKLVMLGIRLDRVYVQISP
jgi:hypothetical protein